MLVGTAGQDLPVGLGFRPFGVKALPLAGVRFAFHGGRVGGVQPVSLLRGGLPRAGVRSRHRLHRVPVCQVTETWTRPRAWAAGPPSKTWNPRQCRTPHHPGGRGSRREAPSADGRMRSVAFHVQPLPQPLPCDRGPVIDEPPVAGEPGDGQPQLPWIAPRLSAEGRHEMKSVSVQPSTRPFSFV